MNNIKNIASTCRNIPLLLMQIIKMHLHLSIVAGLVVRHGDLSHEMTLSHQGRRPECDNVNRV